MSRTARHRRRDEDGSLSIYFISAIAAVIPLIGLVVDGSGQVRAIQSAELVAGEAARSAGQTVDPGDAINGEDVFLDRTAIDTAKQYVTREGMTPGRIYLHPDKREITVVAETTYDPIFLGALGLGPWRVTGEATSRMHQTDLNGDDYSTESPGSNS